MEKAVSIRTTVARASELSESLIIDRVRLIALDLKRIDAQIRAGVGLALLSMWALLLAWGVGLAFAAALLTRWFELPVAIAIVGVAQLALAVLLASAAFRHLTKLGARLAEIGRDAVDPTPKEGAS